MIRSLLCLLAVFVALQAVPTEAADKPRPVDRITGVMFADYYNVLSADDADASLPEKRNAFRFRRLYFTWDDSLSEQFDVRFRLEANDAGFGSGDKMKPFVKHAYLKWHDALGGDLYIGESGTPSWKLSESVWGYRSIEKTVLDLNKIGSSADIGLAWKGKAAGATLHLMVANGPGQKPENNNGKKVYASLQLQPAGTHLELYGDLDMVPDGDEITLKAFLGRSSESSRFGAEVFTHIEREASVSDPGEDATLLGVSLFATVPVRQDWQGFARLDVINDDDADTSDLLIIGGLDWEAGKGLHIMPNVYVQIPDGPDPNIQFRVTGHFKF